MTITVNQSENVCTLQIEGRIDTVTSAQLESTFQENAAGCEKMIFDLTGVDYISSAGIRVLIASHRQMDKKGGLVLRGLNRNVLSILKMTGFDKIFSIES